MKNKNDRIIEIDGKKIDLSKLSNEDLLKIAKYTLNKMKKSKKDLDEKVQELNEDIRDF